MTDEEHRDRHLELHRALDELLADWAAQQPRDGSRLFQNTTIAELMEWSYQQTKQPTRPTEVLRPH